MSAADWRAYASREEIDDFCCRSARECLGFSYVWEGEGVVHVHTAPLPHAFGESSRCLFCKSEVSPQQFTAEIRYVLSVDCGVVSLYKEEGGLLQKIPLHFIPGREELYSRSRGLLEVDILSQKHVVLVGLGSFGSQIAIELAKAGVGQFSLFDFDRVELHNLGRHTCTVKDLGRLKTDAIAEAIVGKNPYAKVHTYPVNIAEEWRMLDLAVSASDLVICATDNNSSRFLISSFLCRYNTVGIFGRATTRAAGGDVFRYRPGGPCYGCLVCSQIINMPEEEISSEEAGRRSGAIPAYASSEDVDTMVQVGLSVDIAAICNLMLKLSLLELSKGKASGISSLEDDLKYDAYVWANRRDTHFAHWHTFYQSGGKQTILRWYGINLPKDPHCAICSDDVKLDTGAGGSEVVQADVNLSS